MGNALRLVVDDALGPKEAAGERGRIRDVEFPLDEIPFDHREAKDRGMLASVFPPFASRRRP